MLLRLGPYPQEQQWRVIEIDANGRRKSHLVDSRQGARRLIARLGMNMNSRTIEATIDLWVATRLRSSTATSKTAAEQAARVQLMLSSVLERRLDEAAERKAASLYEKATTEPSERTGQPLRAATHRYDLTLTRRLLAWAQKLHLRTLLAQTATSRQPDERLCSAGPQALHEAVVKLCQRASVPQVCVHGLRGTHAYASLAVSGGAAVEAVARVLGHASTKMTLSHYITDEVATGTRLAAVESSLHPAQSFRGLFLMNSPTEKSGCHPCLDFALALHQPRNNCPNPLEGPPSLFPLQTLDKTPSTK